MLWLREPALSVRGIPSSPSFPGLLAGPRSQRPPAVQLWGLCLGRWGVRTAGAGGAEHRGSGEGPWACRGHTEGPPPPGGSVPGRRALYPGGGRHTQRVKAEGGPHAGHSGGARAGGLRHERGRELGTGQLLSDCIRAHSPVFSFLCWGVMTRPPLPLRGLLGLTRLGRGPDLCSYNTLFSPLSSYSRWT